MLFKLYIKNPVLIFHRKRILRTLTLMENYILNNLKPINDNEFKIEASGLCELTDIVDSSNSKYTRIYMNKNIPYDSIIRKGHGYWYAPYFYWNRRLKWVHYHIKLLS